MFLPFPVISPLAAVVFLIFSSALIHAQDKLPTDSATIFINETDTLFTKVDTVATYPGGGKAWAKFLLKNLHYPQEAQDNEIMGDTRISFLVDVDGTVSNIKAVYGDPALTPESERIIQISGKWLPAVHNGQPVKSYHIQPIIYKLVIAGGRRGKK